MLPPLGFDDFDPYNRTSQDEYLDNFGLPSFSSDDGDTSSPSFVEALDNFFGFLNSVHSNLTQEFRTHHGKWRQATQTLRRRLKKETLEDRLRQQLVELRTRLAEPPVVALRCKVSFFLGVTNVVLAAFLFGKRPDLIPRLYAIDYTLLVALRVWIYRKKGWQYFTLDLCYYANTLLLLYLFVFPSNKILLGGVIGLAHGPVLWAIIQWRNSLVFHSLDKITSCFIHFCPAMVLYGIRWLSTEEAKPADQFPLVASTERVNWTSTFITALTLHMIWQALYYIIVYIHQREKITSGTRVTSYTWLVREGENRNTLLFKVVDFYGPKHRLKMYMLVQLIYTVVTLLPVNLVWNSQYLHTGLILSMFAMCVWNGSTYYVDVFSQSYAKSIQRIHRDLLLQQTTSTASDSTGVHTPAEDGYEDDDHRSTGRRNMMGDAQHHAVSASGESDSGQDEDDQ